jgi:hypothetical protein
MLPAIASGSFFAKNKTIIIIIVIVVVVLLVVYFSGRSAGKKKGDRPQVDYPQGGEGIPSGWSPEPLARELRDTMSGVFTSAATKEAAWFKLLNLATDDMFVAVYDVFNQLFIGEGDGTLREWINAEYNVLAIGSNRDGLNQRFDRLNLS